MNKSCQCFKERLAMHQSIVIGSGEGGPNFEIKWEDDFFEDGTVLLNLKYSFQNTGKRKTYRKAAMVTRYCPFCGIDNRPGKQ